MSPRQAPAAPSPLRVGVAVAIAAIAAVAFLVALVIWEDRTIVDVVTYIGIPLTSGGVGAYLTIRVPTNRIGPLLLGATVCFALLVGGGAIAWYGVGTGAITPVTTRSSTSATIAIVASTGVDHESHRPTAAGARLRRRRLTLRAPGRATVSAAGLVGFVGLVVPHIARRLGAASHRTLLPASAIAGAVLVVLADLVARVALPPAELPLGAVTAVLGVPFFLTTLRRLS